VLIVEIYDGSC